MRPTDDVFKAISDVASTDGFIAKTGRVLVRSRADWLDFIDVSSIRQAKPWRKREAFKIEAGAFLKGAAHPNGANIPDGYEGEPAKGALDCHFRWIMLPPIGQRASRAIDYWDTALWGVLADRAKRHAITSMEQDLLPWFKRLEDMSKVGEYVTHLAAKKSQSRFDSQIPENWGRVYGLDAMVAFFVADKSH